MKKYYIRIIVATTLMIGTSSVYAIPALSFNPSHPTPVAPLSAVIQSLKSTLLEMEKLLASLSLSALKKPSSLTASAVLGGTMQGGIIGTPRTARTAVNAVVPDSLSPFTTVQIKGDYTARGVGLRGQTSGSIVLTGIPTGATVERAYLYWSFLDNGLLPSEKNLTLNSAPIIGTEIGNGGDTCWGRSASRAFRADVTALVSGNGTYALSNIANETPLLAQGASLVVIYKDGGANHTIVIKDGNAANTDTGNLSTVVGGFTANGIFAKTTFIVGDGQPFGDTLSFTGGRGTFTADNAFDGSDGAFWDTDTYDVSAFVASGDTSVSATMPLQEDCLNWVAQVFSVTGGEPPPIGNVAAGLAKELVNSSYLFGGKGWEYNTKEFVAPTVIKTGYNFWNQATTTPAVDFGAGVDCSGLVMWSYNRAFDPQKSRFNNFVKAEGADEQFRQNTTTTTEAELQPGDVMFFDNVPKNGFIDHVAMYVGESGGFDVVNAANPVRGIVPDLKDSLKQLSGFVAFKKVTSASPPSVLISAGSPIDFIVTDPDGFTITPTTIIPSELEFLRQIPGVLYYSEMEKGADGRPIDQVYSYLKKTGDYLIKVLPEPEALPTDTFSLFFTTDLATTTVLAEHILISNIPAETYLIRSTETGIEKIIPALVDIKPETIKLSDKTFDVLVQVEPGFGASVRDIDLTSIKLADAKPFKTSFEEEEKICPAGPHGKEGNRKDNDKKDCDDDEEVLTLVAKFRAKDLKNIPVGKNVKILFTAKLFDGTKVEGADTVRVIKKL